MGYIDLICNLERGFVTTTYNQSGGIYSVVMKDDKLSFLGPAEIVAGSS